MEAFLKTHLPTNKLKQFGHGGGGCINKGVGYESDVGMIFVKINAKDGAKVMFEGEHASLRAIADTRTIRVPKPIAAFADASFGACLVTEYLTMAGKGGDSRKFGNQLARLHLHNAGLITSAKRDETFVHLPPHKTTGSRETHDEVGVSSGSVGVMTEPVHQFGFPMPTCCGFLPQKNDWMDDWPTFFARNRLQHQVDMLTKKTSGDRELLELWSQLQRTLPSFFTDCGRIVPSLLHGDLWSGNYSSIGDGEPVIFDPASFYGHSEYEFGIIEMFGGFPRDFFAGYHELLPRANGFDRRLRLYELFHNLNHWNHFGGGYRSPSLSIMKSLCK